jgi:hypothetical protein
VKNTNKKIILFSLLTIGMILSTIAPALAYPSRNFGVYRQGIAQVTTNPGTTFMVGKTQYTLGSTSISYLSGGPFGNGTGTGVTVYLKLDPATKTGTGKDYVVDTFANGTIEGFVKVTLLGPGNHTYQGPTFTFNLNGKNGTVTHGATYIGGIATGTSYKHGVSGELEGLETQELFTVVNVMVGPLSGIMIVDNMVAYKLP